MTTTNKKSIDEQVIDLLYSEGPMDCKQMATTIPYKYKSISTKCLDLERNNLIERDEDRIWSLREGVTPQTLVTGELGEPLETEEPGQGEEPGQEGPKTGKKPQPILKTKGVPLDQRSMFITHMTAIGVTPREAIPTIADLFFDGDIEDLNWLNRVLQRSAAGYVKANQRRLIMDWWAKTRNLPYDEGEYFTEDEGDGKGKGKGDKVTKEEVKTEKRLDPGMGWKVDRDKDGAWITVPGGPMSYQEAIEAAERRALIASYNRGGADQESEGEEGLEEGAPARKGTKKTETLMEYMMKKMVDNMLDGTKGKGDGDSETVRVLTERIDSMERERTEDRFERIEGMIAQALSRDPWEDYDRITAMKERLGGGTSVVTDQSPAVQLIKDTTDKMDKNVSRLTGLFERTVLHSDVFQPEETRTTKERTQKAGELLGEVETRDRSRTLRKDAFNM